MATYDLEEQEQIEELKTWWKLHGARVTAVLFAAALVAAGWQGWGWWQRNQGAQASVIYSQLQQVASQSDAKRGKELAGVLIEKFPRTRYAEMGALLSAKLQMESDDLKNARAQLEWLVANGDDAALRDLARLRLATVLLQDGLHDDAQRTLAVEPVPDFKPRFLELSGDIHAIAGRSDEALVAYGQAIKLLDTQIQSGDSESERRARNYRDMLTTKRDFTQNSTARSGGTK